MHAFEELNKCIFRFDCPFVAHFPKKRHKRGIAAGVSRYVSRDMNTTVQDVAVITEDLGDGSTLCMVTVTYKDSNTRMVLEEKREKLLKLLRCVVF